LETLSTHADHEYKSENTDSWDPMTDLHPIIGLRPTSPPT